MDDLNLNKVSRTVDLSIRVIIDLYLQRIIMRQLKNIEKYMNLVKLEKLANWQKLEKPPIFI